MAIILDPILEGRGYGIDDAGSAYAERPWLVHDGAGALITEDEAVAAVMSAYPRNAPHPRNSTCTVAAHGPAEYMGPGVWKVSVRYTVPESGSQGEDTTDLLLRTPVVRWSTRTKEIPMDFDADGRFICNSAGYPPAEPATRIIYIDVLQIERWEPFYNIDLCRNLRGRVNSASVLLGRELFEPGEVLMTQAVPAAEFPAGTTPIKMLYEWEFTNHTDNPYQLFFKDVGTYGCATVNGATIWGPIGSVVTVDGVTQFQQVTEPVLLDGTGKPKNTSLKIGYRSGDKWLGATPITNPDIAALPAIFGQPADIPGSVAWMRRYRRVLSADFSVLGI